MTTLILVTQINASPEVCFDLSCDVQEHAKSLGESGETIVGGRTDGLLGPGESLVLRGRHFGIYWTLGVRISEYDRPNRFVDEMVSGPFKSVWHEHTFEPFDGGTRMTDTFRFAAPFGPIGKLTEILVLKSYMRALLERRRLYLKRLAEKGS